MGIAEQRVGSRHSLHCRRLTAVSRKRSVQIRRNSFSSVAATGAQCAVSYGQVKEQASRSCFFRTPDSTVSALADITDVHRERCI